MLNEMLINNLSTQAYTLWSELNQSVPRIWDKPTSSSGRYHQKKDGRVPTCEEHTCEMLNAYLKIKRAFNSKDHDVIILSIALHDILKYGPELHMHTKRNHDSLAGDFITANRKRFLEVFSVSDTDIIEAAVRFHSGKWSSDLSGEISFNSMPKEVLIVHMLDMMSTADVLEGVEIG